MRIAVVAGVTDSFDGISRKDFFDVDIGSPNTLNETAAALRSLSPKQLDLLTALANEMK